MMGNKLDEVNIRQACSADQMAIQEVTLSAYQEYSTHIPAQHWQAYRRNILETLSAAQPEMQLVAELKGEIVGSVLMVLAEPVFDNPNGVPRRPEFPEVRLLAVTPPARGQGIGKAIMQACIAQAHRDGFGALTLHTSEMMQTAMHMYEQLGFRRDPKMDFRPTENIIINGYRLELEQ